MPPVVPVMRDYQHCPNYYRCAHSDA